MKKSKIMFLLELVHYSLLFSYKWFNIKIRYILMDALLHKSTSYETRVWEIKKHLFFTKTLTCVLVHKRFNKVIPMLLYFMLLLSITLLDVNSSMMIFCTFCVILLHRLHPDCLVQCCTNKVNPQIVVSFRNIFYMQSTRNFCFHMSGKAHAFGPRVFVRNNPFDVYYPLNKQSSRHPNVVQVDSAGKPIKGNPPAEICHTPLYKDAYDDTPDQVSSITHLGDDGTGRRSFIQAYKDKKPYGEEEITKGKIHRKATEFLNQKEPHDRAERAFAREREKALGLPQKSSPSEPESITNKQQGSDNISTTANKSKDKETDDKI